MPVPVKMPKLGMTMTEGTLVRWVIAEGDAVEKGQMIAEVVTDKLVNEMESPGAGTLAGVDEGEVVPVAHTMAWIIQKGETAQEIPGTQDEGGGKTFDRSVLRASTTIAFRSDERYPPMPSSS